MTRLRLLVSSLLPLLLAACATAPPPAERALRTLVPPIQVQGRTYTPATVEQQMREHRVPAVSMALIDDGRIVWTQAWGLSDVEAGRKATTSTLFQAASVSKPVAATAALTLVDAGRLTLDEDVNTRLRTWQVPSSGFAGKVTPRRLMSHTAGLTVHGFPGYERGSALPSVVQILNGEPPANSAAIKVDIEPGSMWRYSGGGYVVLQTLLGDVTGKPFPQVMREQVLGHAGMRDSTFEQPIPDAALPRTATAYDDDGKPVEGQHHVYPELAAAGLWTTPADLAKWLLALDDLLTPATRNAMFTEQLEKSRFGLGIGLDGSGDDLVLSHAGSNRGFRATFRYLPARRQGVVIMTSSENGAAVVLPMLHALANQYGWPGIKATVLVPVETTAGALREIAGTYVPPDRPLELVISTEGDQAFMTVAGKTTEIIPTASDVFSSVQGGTLKFERDESGKITGVSFNGRKLRRKE
jgi:CubicO group peptidase (beta-lactamase class C family)